jgi:prepilin-type N-terminal cleavage/methylation domain-containing protein
MSTKRRAHGFTLVELLLAVGLFSILILALLRLVDTSLTIWSRTDENRELSEMSAAILDLFAADVHALEGGARGDLLADWALFDVDRDGIAGAPRERVRLVRHLDAAGLRRLAPDSPAALETFDRGLAEVCWVHLAGSDDPDQRPLGTLLRGERVLGERETTSFFAEGFLGRSGKPLPGSAHELTGGVLWFSAWFASQTSILHQGWTLGDELSDCTASWDAWTRQRPDPEVSYLNRSPAGMPVAKDVPLLPRRVRVELELERPADLRRRTRLAAELPQDATRFEVRDGRRLPPVGEMILIDEEWMKLVSVVDNRVSVERAQRATRAAPHADRALVHHGWRSVREISVDTMREDWNL